MSAHSVLIPLLARTVELASWLLWLSKPSAAVAWYLEMEALRGPISMALVQIMMCNQPIALGLYK